MWACLTTLIEGFHRPYSLHLWENEQNEGISGKYDQQWFKNVW